MRLKQSFAAARKNATNRALRNFKVRLPRRFHAFCLGMAKSGSHSIHAIFSQCYNSAHEPEDTQVISSILSHAYGDLDDTGLLQFVREHDRRLWLEMNASHLNYFLLGPILTLFPECKFVLLIRDCYSWTDSFINHQLTLPANEIWREFRDLRFKSAKDDYAKEEVVLNERGLYTLDGYFRHWARFINDVTTRVPDERLLSIRTKDLSASIPRIAEHLGIAPDTLDQSGLHSFAAKSKLGVLSQINRDFVDERANEHCRALMETYFPEIRSAADALP